MMRDRTPSHIKSHLQQSPDLQKLRKKRRTTRRRLWILIGILFVVLCVGIVFASRIPKIQITTVTITGNEVTDSEDISAHVEKYLTGYYAYVIPHRNALIYPKELILREIESSFPRLRDITIERVGWNTLAVRVFEVRGNALWCGSEFKELDPATQCYFTDGSGEIVDAAPFYSGNVYMRFYGGTLDASNPIGNSFVEAKMFTNLMEFARKVVELGFPVTAIVISPTGEDMFMLDVGEGTTAVLRFKAEDNYETLAGNLMAALSKEELQALLAKSRSTLEYFDLRFTNKIYYKFREQF